MSNNAFRSLLRDCVGTLVEINNVETLVSWFETRSTKTELARRERAISRTDLLTTTGKVAIALIRDPFASPATLADRLSMSQHKVRLAMTNLGDRWGLVRTNVLGRTRYNIDLRRVLEHPDIAVLLETLSSFPPRETETEGDITR